MSVKDKRIPNETSYIKLKDYPDGERIKVVSAGVNEQGRFGAQPYFVNEDGERISLPTRYVDYIYDIMGDENNMKELRNGLYIIKGSRETQNGGTTPTFEFE